jgi:hypothetical protein
MLDFLRDGKIVGCAQLFLFAFDASGWVAYVGGVPLGGFPLGVYEVRLTLAQGEEKVISSMRFDFVS